MLIGLCGRPDSGQDLITNYLACGNRAFHVITFDAPLRHMIQACAGIHETYFSLAKRHDVIPALGKSPAQLLHTLREAWIRAPMDPDVLVRHFAQTLARHDGRNVVAPDVSTQAEAEFIQTCGGQLIRVVSRRGLGADPSIKRAWIDLELEADEASDWLYAEIDAIVGEDVLVG
ncbi:hypothetical protein [Cupriavidus basilensis]|uniref:hypothetical protein n=1 Tax=Cupriavidus basilensis TaxID=68895 RepID=UPI00284230C3|nr:hypothetical protein [Cupriavidus basilensis]MDR3383981.1 hypothetical protein [Cupriavidus basilensis]